MEALNFTGVSCNPVCVSGKGAKSVEFAVTINGAPVTFTTDPAQVCFEPSAYGDAAGTATRVNVVFRPQDTTALELEGIDRWILKCAAANSVAWFGKQKTADQLEESYTPLVKRSEKYGPQFKAKMNLAPPAQTKIWGGSELREAPEIWKGCTVRPKFHLRGLYFMGSAQFGPILECTDVQILEEPSHVCPF